MNTVKMRAYAGKGVYEAEVRSTEEGVEEFRQSVLEAMCIEVPETGEPVKSTVLVGIPGGKA